ncbi:MAG: M28 family metallopeptidase [Wenzhouxiangellaceae bacterium]
MRIRIAGCCLLLISSLAHSQGQPPAQSAEPLQTPYLTPALRSASQQLIEQALADDTAYAVVESLTTEVGPRLAGTEAEARARDWAVRTLTDMGFANVRSEPFKVWRWRRGHEHAAIVQPFPQPLSVTALGHSVATPAEGITAEVVRFATLDDLREMPADSLKGKIVFVDEGTTRTQDGVGYGMAVQMRSGAAAEGARRGAVAALIRSVGTDPHRFPHTGVMRYEADVPAIPAAALAAPDADQLTRALARGTVSVRLHLDNEGGGRTGSAWEGEAAQLVESGNVIAEVPGETDEVVVLGAHLDSWDLGTGAIDDGAGIGIITAAARLIQQWPQKPRRTIRIVYFGSEEVGIAGSKAYADRYADTLDRHMVAVESDFGARRIWRLQTAFGDDQLDKAKAFFRVLRPLGVTPGDNLARGGPDLTFLRLGGVPVVSLTQNGWDYFDYHHTADDTLDKIDREDLAQNVAVYTAFAWLAANIEGGFRAVDAPATDE